MSLRYEMSCRLLARLDRPLGTVTVVCRRAGEGREFLVEHAPGVRFPDAPATFEGLAVVYRVRTPVRAAA